MTRIQQKRLKEIDEVLLRTALGLYNLLKERAEIDRESTAKFIEELARGFRAVALEKE